MRIDRLIDEWSDPVKDMYLKELSVLSKGLVINYKSEKDLSLILSKIFIFNSMSSTRPLLEYLLGSTNLDIISGDVLQIRVFDIESKKYEEAIFKDSYQLIGLFIKDIIERKRILSNNAYISIKLLQLSEERIRKEIRFGIKESNAFSQKIINHIRDHFDSFLINSRILNDFKNKAINDKNLIQLLQLNSLLEIATVNSRNKLSRTKQSSIIAKVTQYEKSILKKAKLKNEYLDMLLEESELSVAILSIK